MIIIPFFFSICIYIYNGNTLVLLFDMKYLETREIGMKCVDVLALRLIWEYRDAVK